MCVRCQLQAMKVKPISTHRCADTMQRNRVLPTTADHRPARYVDRGEGTHTHGQASQGAHDQRVAHHPPAGCCGGRAGPCRAAPGRARPPDGFSVAQGQAQGDEDGDQPHALRTQQRVGQQPVWPAE
jgi:hypothetical protein